MSAEAFPAATGSGTTRRAAGGADLYELYPDDLLNELNGARDYDRITVPLKR